MFAEIPRSLPFRVTVSSDREKARLQSLSKTLAVPSKSISLLRATSPRPRKVMNFVFDPLVLLTQARSWPLVQDKSTDNYYPLSHLKVLVIRAYGFLLFIGCVILTGNTPAIASQQKPTVRILYINSYEPSLPWVMKLTETIIKTFPPQTPGEPTSERPDYRLTREHLNGKFYWGDVYLDAIVSEMRKRYSPGSADRPDIILASDDLAFYFLTRVPAGGSVSVRDELFGNDVPVVFCGVNNWDTATELKPIGNGYWGALEQPGVEKTVRFIKAAFPRTRIFLLSDAVEITGPAWLHQMKSAVEKEFPREAIEELDGRIRLEDLEAKISSLDANSVILLGAYYRDLWISTDTFAETTDRICRTAQSHDPPIPVFGLLDMQKGDPSVPRLGIYGGWLISGQSQAQKLVELAVQVLNQPKEKRIDFVNRNKPVPWPQNDKNGNGEPEPMFFQENIPRVHRSTLARAAKDQGLDPIRIGILPPKSLLATLWEPIWGKVIVILLAKTGLMLLLGFRFPKAALAILRSRDSLSPSRAPEWIAATVPMLTGALWAVLFVPDIPTKNWLLRRALRQITLREPIEKIVARFRAQHSLLGKARVNMPVASRDTDASHIRAHLRDQLINAVGNEEQFFVCISGRGGAGKSSMALDMALAVMMKDQRNGTTLSTVLATVPDHWLQEGKFLRNLSVFVKDRINGLVGLGAIDEEMALEGLTSGQICLIIDGLSEMPAVFEDQFGTSYFTQGLPRKLIISSRSMDQHGLRELGGSQWEIPPLEGESLLRFIRDFIAEECNTAGVHSVKNLDIQDASVKQFLISFVTRQTEPWHTFLDRVSAKINGQYFSDPWTSRSSCLFVEMRLSALLRKCDDESLAALCRVFIGRLIEKLSIEDRPSVDAVIKDMTTLSWHVLSKNNFCAAQFSVGQVTPLLAKDSLPILTDHLGMIELSDLGRMGCFTCDPIAEYLAAAYMMELEPSEFASARALFLAALSKLKVSVGEPTYKMRGFVVGIVDCLKHGQFRKENEIELSDEIREKLDIPFS
ncbi:MAG: hypothetical protein ACJ8NS_05835 [Chthoniobacterales bacterium]